MSVVKVRLDFAPKVTPTFSPLTRLNSCHQSVAFLFSCRFMHALLVSWTECPTLHSVQPALPYHTEWYGILAQFRLPKLITGVAE
jgi:hypothetical protein